MGPPLFFSLAGGEAVNAKSLNFFLRLSFSISVNIRYCGGRIHCKKIHDFPASSGDVTIQTLPDGE
jgi:hypothetical protein